MEMWLYSSDINVVQMNLGKSTYIFCVNSVPTSTVVLAVINISEDTEWTLNFFDLREVFLCQDTLNILRKRVGHTEYLLLKNKIQINLLV